MLIEWVSFAAVSVVALAMSAGLGSTRQFRAIRNLLIAGAIMRIVGVLARYSMIFDLYDGESDAVAYFESGKLIAAHFRTLDFSIIGSGLWGNREWGTQAVRYASGFVLTFVGPSVRGAFLVFSVAAFIGLVCMAVAFRRVNSSASMQRATWLLFFWPTLWFWPSSIGKEAILILAVGLVIFGYVGRAERIHWIPMISGLGLALSIRPHLAGVLAISISASEWASRGWSLRRIVQSAVASALAVWILLTAFNLLGLGGADFEAIQSFQRVSSERTDQGGSAFKGPGNAVAAVPMAFLNVLFRPFITEVHSPMTLVSSLEMLAFWLLMIRYRRNAWAALRSWRSNRLMRFVIPFAIAYVVMIGVTFQNAGIIARQRTLVMPALLLVLAGLPAERASRARINRPRRVWQNAAPDSLTLRPNPHHEVAGTRVS